MKILAIFCCSLLITSTLSAQRLSSTIEGLLEVYDPEDTTSLYLGKNAGIQVETNSKRANTFVGTNAGRVSTTGSNNSFFGSSAGENNTTGVGNSFLGNGAGRKNTTAFNNTFVGQAAGASNTTGYQNSFFGTFAGERNTTGSNNSFFGTGSGNNLRGTNNICIGSFSGPSALDTLHNRLFVDVGFSMEPLIYGEFDNDLLRINGTLVMGNTDYFGGNDDGIVRSSTDGSGSDLFLVANDAVIVEISDNVAENGTFEVWNDGNNDKLLILDENGDLDLKGVVGSISDVHQKEEIVPVNPPEILGKLRSMPISEWQYIGNPVRHIGPMAQDFYQAFGLGKSDTRITTIDADGVVMAAIQALAQENDALRKENEAVKERVHRIEKILEKLSAPGNQ